MMNDRPSSPSVSAFAYYLRTGRRISASELATIETKFNPWHDPEDGHKVGVDIAAHYEGVATRPARIVVTTYVDGRRHIQRFRNLPKGK